MNKKKAIYLSGGGARGAYQVGVLMALRDILNSKRLPVELLSSVSVGSINAAYLAQYADDFKKGVDGLEALWSGLSPSQVYRTDSISLLLSLVRNIGSFLFHVKGNGYLLNTEPLRALVETKIDFQRIRENVEQGLCELELSSICYERRQTMSYYDSIETYPSWQRLRHAPQKTHINASHVLASSALPLFFEPVSISERHHGDGGLRLAYPLRASIKMKVSKVLVIGTRRTADLNPSNLCYRQGISFASLLGQMLNALFLDNLERELLHISQVNRAQKFLTDEQKKALSWHHVEVLALKPSIDIGELAIDSQHVLPRFLRYLLLSLGEKHQAGDILSFLLFDKDYCQKLLGLGFDDAMKQKQNILAFFEDES